jgi:hypothetical protein
MSNIYTDPPQSRNEAIIKSTIDGTQYTDPPQSRMEDLLLDLKEAIEGGGGGGTTVVANPEGEATDELEKLQVGSDIYGIPKDYEDLDNKPSINSVELSGNKTASELGLQAELDGAQTVSGNPITVADAESMNAESVVVELEPKQDLHGYDAPWVGGAGKNKLPLVLADIKAANTDGTWNGDTYVLSGMSYSVLTDGDGNVTGINIDGTTASYPSLVLYNGTLPLGNYILTLSDNNNVRYRIFKNGDTLKDSSDPFSFAVDNAEDVYLIIIFTGSGSISNVLAKPMIRLATETDPTYAPYSNICPISGYSEVNVERNGVNYAINTLENLKTLNATGTWDSNRYTINGVTFTASTDDEGNVTSINLNGTSGAGSTRLFLRQNESLGKYVGGKLCAGSSSNRFGIVLQQSGGQYRYYASAGSEKTDIGSFQDGAVGSLYMSCDPEITYNNVVAKPTLYDNQGNAYTIDLDGTKYGGTLDVTDGKFIDDHGYATINYASLVDGLFRAQAPNDVNWSYPSCKCSCLEVWDTVDDLADNYGISYDDGYFYMNLPPECGATESAVQTWLQNNPIGVVYVTSDVTEESTTPTDIPLLENTNNISTDGTNITLKYQPNNVIGECKAYTDEKCAEVLPPLPTTDGTYHLSCEVTSGVGVLSWVSDS